MVASENKFTPDKLALLEKNAIMAALVQNYTDSKPINDQLVDISLRIQALTAEIYRRSIMKQLPGIAIRRQRTVMKIGCTVHPNTGLPQIAQRVVQLKADGVEVIEVVYDENTGEFSFLSEPEFVITPQPEK